MCFPLPQLFWVPSLLVHIRMSSRYLAKKRLITPRFPGFTAPSSSFILLVFALTVSPETGRIDAIRHDGSARVHQVIVSFLYQGNQSVSQDSQDVVHISQDTE